MMVWRIVVQPSGFKVSKPGVDVFSAGPQDLLFDSNNIAFGPTWLTGTVVPSTPADSPLQDIARDATINYPVGWSFTPFVMAQSYESASGPAYAGGIVNVQDSPSTNRGLQIFMQTNRVIIRSYHQLGGGWAPVRYVVILTATS